MGIGASTNSVVTVVDERERYIDQEANDKIVTGPSMAARGGDGEVEGVAEDRWGPDEGGAQHPGQA